ncbi:MAG: thymidylate kinase [Saprospiraceae bacterium]|nr:thymidylate kinase [Saprospiraceae bacterium]
MLIAFSGVDGAGKTTQIELLVEHLISKGIKSKVIWSRGGYTPLFNWMKNVAGVSKSSSKDEDQYQSLRNRSLNNRSIRTLWLFIAMVDLFFLYALEFRWHLFRGKWVIADRYLLDTEIDFDLNFAQEKFDKWLLWKITKWLSPKPNKHFLLLIPVEESQRRSRLKNEPFPNSYQILSYRLEIYQRSCLTSRLFSCLNCQDPIEEIHRRIINSIV